MPLISSKQELDQHLTASTAIEYTAIRPYIIEAESRFIEPILGKQEYNELVQAYTNSTTSAAQDVILPKIQKALANFAYVVYMPVVNVQISDAGIRADRENSAFKWQVDKVEETFLSIAYRTIDELLAYLEANKVSYPAWAESSAYTILKSNILQDANSFNEYVNIDSSRRTFLKLRQHMKVVEDFTIKALLTPTLFNTLKTSILAGNLTTQQISLIDKIKPVIAYLSISKAMTSMSFRISQNGAVEHSIKATSGGNKEEKIAAKETLNLFKLETHQTGEAYLKELVDFLNANATDYPGFENSESYIADTSIETDEITDGSTINLL